MLKAGTNERVALEVITYLSSEILRTIALSPTQGLARGSRVINTDRSLQIPVGNALLGRMFDVFGDAIDGQKLLSDEKLRSLE